ncbi:hypothetical protein WA577_004272 [Blastocystis sp. JDR]
MAALISAVLRIISTVGIMIVNMGSNSHGTECGWNEITSFNVECLAKMWMERDDNHGWDTVFNIIDCVSMILMIWVFDGLRTINKDKDIGTLMVNCMQVATIINVITTLIELGLFNAAKNIGSWNIGNYYPDLEIAYQLARGSFSWLFTIDDLLMVIPYFWCYMLSTENDRIPSSYAHVSLLLSLCSFLFFLFSLFRLVDFMVGALYGIVTLLYVLLRFVWLFQSYAIFKKQSN